ncbi:MAG: GAF domain-containing protein [Sphingomonas sp.]
MPNGSREAVLRQAAVFASGLLVMRRDPTLAAIVAALAARVDTPIAGICVVDRGACWLPVATGLEAEVVHAELALCPHVVAAGAPLLIPDLTADARFADHDMVTGSCGLRAYAAAPLRGYDGASIGTIFVADQRPREDFTDIQALLVATSTRITDEAQDVRHQHRLKPFAIEGLSNLIRDALRDGDHTLVTRLDRVLRAIETGSARD